MWSRSHSIITKDITIEQAWKCFADVNNWNKWDTEVSWSKLDQEFQTLSSFILKPKNGPTSKIIITECIPYKKFIAENSFPGAKMQFIHCLENTENGLLITQEIIITGFLSWIWQKLVGEKLYKNISSTTNKFIVYTSKNY